jgi:prophage regulatory protein
MPLPSDRFLRLQLVMQRTGLSRATIYRKVQAKTFPQSRKLGSSCVGWYESEIDEWVTAPR